MNDDHGVRLRVDAKKSADLQVADRQVHQEAPIYPMALHSCYVLMSRILWALDRLRV
jgi:hypothetical protein